MNTLRIAEAIEALGNTRWARIVMALVALALMSISAAWVALAIAARPDWPVSLDMGLYLEAAQNLIHGRNPYGADGLHRYPYPPLFAELVALLVMIFGSYAPYLWVAASGAFLILAVWLMNRSFGFRTPAPWIMLAAGLLLIGRVARSDLLHGQVNFWILLLLVLGLMSWRAQRMWLASAVWAFAICCKPFLGVLVLFLLRQGSWKPALITFGLSGVLFFISFLPTFPDVLETFQSWRLTTQHYASPAYAANPLNQSFYGLSLRLFTENQFSQPWVAEPALAFVLLALAIGVASIVFWINSSSRPDHSGEKGAFDLARFGASIAAILTLGPVFEGDHLYFALPGAFGCFALTWARVRANAPTRMIWLAASGAWALVFALLAWPRQLVLHFNSADSWVHLEGVGILLSGAAGVLLLAAAAGTAVALTSEGAKQFSSNQPLRQSPAA